MIPVEARLELEPFDPHAELGRFTAARAEAGAVAAFIGLVRGEETGGAVESLTLEHYPSFTERSLQTIAREAAGRFDVSALLVVHRAGTMSVGDPIVLAAATARHRRAALDAVDFLMDALKCDAAFWKREAGPGGGRWIEPTEADRAARGRWS
jgi:molybdopterin synthase catalytic subunit